MSAEELPARVQAEETYVVANVVARMPVILSAECRVTALIADPTTEWGKPFRPYEPVMKVTYDDGRAEYYSGNDHVLWFRPGAGKRRTAGRHRS